MMKLFFLLSQMLVGAPEGAQPVSVGVYAPSLFFAGSAEKAEFLSKVESSLGDALQVPVAASFSPDPKQMMGNAIWVVDAPVAATREYLTVVLQARGAHGAAAPVSVYAHKAWP